MIETIIDGLGINKNYNEGIPSFQLNKKKEILSIVLCKDGDVILSIGGYSGIKISYITIMTILNSLREIPNGSCLLIENDEDIEKEDNFE